MGLLRAAAAALLLAGCATSLPPAEELARAEEELERGDSVRGVRRMFDALGRLGETDPARWNRLGEAAAELDRATSDRAFARAESLLWPDAGSARVTLALPFAGTWRVTQGNRGGFSHRRLADRFAWDFQPLAPGPGAAVLAPADGLVERAEDGVPDNEDGARNFARAAGNVVVIRHGAALFSHFCHLANGSVAVREGQPVRRGDAIGRCGASGNAGAPHLHFVLRTGPTPSHFSVPVRFEGVRVERGGATSAPAAAVPEEGDVVAPE